MSNIAQFFAADAPERKKNRRIFTGNNGVTTFNWPVPDNAVEVEVHCWGAGGAGSGFGAGGGGGYVTHVYKVSPGDTLQITVGAYPGGTSSVTVPTQTPTSPISAAGGSSGTPTGGGSGGTGSYTISPAMPTSRTFTASGGTGGNDPGGPAAPYRGGGGAAGSSLGPGGNGAPDGGGGGIGRPGYGTAGGGSIGPAQQGLYGPTSPSEWYYPDEILGSHGPNGAGSGCGGNGTRTNAVPGTTAGILGGGGGGFAQPPPWPNTPFTGADSSNAGIAGGGATGASGGTGMVIIYW
jgi:hypothetical protein